MENIKERRAKSGLRGVARLCALQMLYKYEFYNGSVTDVIVKSDDGFEALLTESISISGMDKNFCKHLLDNSIKNLSEIDNIIIKNLSTNWKIERLDPVIKCILRLGITELLYFPKIPSKVIFNEYIEIAKAFFDTLNVSFVNGLLNKAAGYLRKKGE